MMGFFTRSLTITKNIWHLLMEDKKMLFFPLLSGICLLALFIPYAVILAGIWLEESGGQTHYSSSPHDAIYFSIITFVFYIALYVCSTFFNAALIRYVDGKFKNQSISMSDSVKFAWSRMGLIVIWSMIAATVGVILNILTKHETLEAIIQSILGIAWSLVSFLALPVIVVEGKSPFKAIGESISIFKKVWGENITISSGLGLVMFVMVIIGLGLFYLSAHMPYPGLSVALLLFSIFYFCLIILVFTALKQILATALFTYARTGEIPAGIDKDVLNDAVKQRKK